MFCTNCGKKVPDESKFCPACGVPLYKEEEQTLTNSQTPIVESPKPEIKPEIETESSQQATEAIPSSPDTIEGVIGKNATYYLSEFKKVDEGQKTKFNLAAFFLGLFFCFYRKCGDLFKKYFLIPVVILVVALIVITISSISFSLPIMAVGGILSAIGSVWALVSYIRFGKNFNKEYYAHCKAVLATGNKKKYGTSIGSALIVVVAVVVLSMAPYAISLINIMGSSGSSETIENINAISLNGKYIVIDDANSNNYLVLDFNWNGPNTLQLSSSEDMSEAFDATYKIIPTDSILDWSNAYSLLINSDYLGEDFEIFKFTLFDEDMYYVQLSPEIMEEEGITAMMVPFTEEFGFSSDNTDLYTESSWPNDYSGYNIHEYANTYVSDNQFELELIGLPDDAGFHTNLYWQDSTLESGVVYPGVPSQLDGGSTIILNLNEDGSIHVQLNGTISEKLNSNSYAMASSVADISGEWQDSWSQRCSMTITADGDDYYIVEVFWSSSAWEYDTWSFGGYYDSSTGQLSYDNGRWVSFDESNTEGSADGAYIVLTDMSGTLTFKNDVMYWDDFTSRELGMDFGSTNMCFEKI